MRYVAFVSVAQVKTPLAALVSPEEMSESVADHSETHGTDRNLDVMYGILLTLEQVSAYRRHARLTARDMWTPGCISRGWVDKDLPGCTYVSVGR